MHHGFDNWYLMNLFYEGLVKMVGIELMLYVVDQSLYDDELEELIETLAENDSHHLSLSHHGTNVEQKRRSLEC